MAWVQAGSWGQVSPQHRPARLCLCFPALTTDVIHQSFFMSPLSAHPDRSLSVCWEQHCKLLPGVAGISASTVAKWTIDEVRSSAPPPLPYSALSPGHPRSGGLPGQSWKLPLTLAPAHPSSPRTLLAAQRGLTERLFHGPSCWRGRGAGY